MYDLPNNIAHSPVEAVPENGSKMTSEILEVVKIPNKQILESYGAE